MTPHLTIGTPCTRPENLPAIAGTLGPALDHFEVVWRIRFDPSMLGMPADARRYHSGILTEAKYAPRTDSWKHPYGNRHLNPVIAGIRSDEWFWTLDDDNIALPGFFPRLAQAIAANPHADAVVFRQDILPGKCRHAWPECIGPGLSDGTQVVARGRVLTPIRDEVAADGAWGRRVLEAAGPHVVWVDEPGLLGYNLLRPGKGLGW